MTAERLSGPVSAESALSTLRATGVHLYLYGIPWHAMNVSADIIALYTSLMSTAGRDEDSCETVTQMSLICAR